MIYVSDLPCGCLPADVYRLTARDGLKSLTFTLLDGEFPPGGTAADLPSGNGQAGGDFVATFEITNAPPAGIPGHATVLQDSQDNLLIVTGCDADNDPLTFEICWADPNNPGRLIHGQLEPGDDARTDTWYYTPDTGYSGPDEFYFKAFDGSMYSGCTLFTIEVVPEPCDLDPTSFLIMDHFPGECLCPGTQISLTWDVINHGPGDTINLPAIDWYDRIYFSTDGILDSSDRLLGSVSVMRDQPLAAEGTYSSQAVVTLPDNLTMDGPYFLILMIDDTNLQVESNEDNNFEVLEFCIKPFIQLTAPFGGIFVDPSQILELGWTDVADNISAYVNIALDNDVDPTNGYTPLLTLASEDIDGEGDSAIVDVPDLSPGIYRLYA
ncbi:MAG: hypothetical protein JW829_02595 [Pirellulales bacterium]|nr:hypothetical protein [Pirellulales bacterium]